VKVVRLLCLRGGVAGPEKDKNTAAIEGVRVDLVGRQGKGCERRKNQMWGGKKEC